MKTAIVYSPYWDTLGGGEKYCAAVVKVLIDLNYKVRIFWNDKNILESVKSRYEIDIDEAKVDKEGYLDITTGNFWHKKGSMQQADFIFFVSDGSIPVLYGQTKNVLHFQVPFHGVGGRSIRKWLKKKTIDEVVCNSLFTKEVIDKEFNLESLVVYPPSTMIAGGKKKKIILSVGRFDNLMHSKRQDVLIDAFRQAELKDWKLVMAGGVLHGDEYVQELTTRAGKLEIDLVVNPNWDELKDLYSSASIFWHAAGYGLDLEKFPEKAEHFGISTVEAMSAGAVPVVFDGGGQKEIVSNDVDGYLWREIEELVQYTKKLISENKKMKSLSRSAIVTSKKFSMEVFEREFKKIVG